MGVGVLKIEDFYISLKKEKPKLGQRCLIWVPDLDECISAVYQKRGDKATFSIGSGYTRNDATHFIPFPEEPKELGDDLKLSKSDEKYINSMAGNI